MRDSFKVTPSIKKKIIALASKVGVKLNWNRDPLDSFQWDGNDIACRRQDASNIIHDIAHYAVATKKARAYSDFGLGKGPDSNYNLKIKILYSGSQPSQIEKKASALGIHWEKQLGLDWDNTSSYHCWDVSDLKNEWKNIRYYIRKYKI